MKHICDTFKDYCEAIHSGMQGDIIYCSEKLWKELEKGKSEYNKLIEKLESNDDISQ